MNTDWLDSEEFRNVAWQWALVWGQADAAERGAFEAVKSYIRSKIADEEKPKSGIHWNPLTDDGDVARLEAVCEIDVLWCIDYVSSIPQDSRGRSRESFADHGGDKQKARRYASTRAAAAIGVKA